MKLPYGPRPDAPVRFTARYPLVMFTLPVVALALWFVLPDGPVTIVLLGLVVLGIVFGGLGLVMTRNRDLEREPPRRPGKPPVG